MITQPQALAKVLKWHILILRVLYVLWVSKSERDLYVYSFGIGGGAGIYPFFSWEYLSRKGTRILFSRDLDVVDLWVRE